MGSCSTGCIAEATNADVSAPAALAYDGIANLLIGDGNSVQRYNIAAGTTDLFATGGTAAGVTKFFASISAITVSPQLDVYVGDDPTAGARLLQGRAWVVNSLKLFVPMNARY